MRRLVLSFVTIVLALTLAPAIVAPSVAAAIEPRTSGREHWNDFNGDGFADLAIGAPKANVGGKDDAGAVHVIYSNPPTVLAAGGSDVWHQDVPGILNKAEAGDRFGWSLGTGDFDDDGYGDLAIGIPGEDVAVDGTSVPDLGAVAVLFGGIGGLSARDRFYPFQVDPKSDPDAYAHIEFGWSVHALDSMGPTGLPNPDGRTDLAVGMPGYFDGRGGVVWLGGQVLTPEDMGSGLALLAFSSEQPGARFGMVLAAGDFDSNEADDLAVGGPLAGVPTSPSETVAKAGKVWIRYNLLGSGQALAENVFGVGGVPKAGERFGSALIGVDIGGALDALLVGVPYEDHDGAIDGGIIYRFLSGASGINPSSALVEKMGDQFFGGTSKDGDRFGSSLAWGDFGLSSAKDLAVGLPGRDVAGHDRAGAVAILYNEGIPFGELIRPGSGDYAGEPEARDEFGARLFAADFGANFGPGDWADLAIGVPLEDVGSAVDAGAVHIVYGDPDYGLQPFNDQVWTRNSPAIPGNSTARDRFGGAVR